MAVSEMKAWKTVVKKTVETAVKNVTVADLMFVLADVEKDSVR